LALGRWVFVPAQAARPFFVLAQECANNDIVILSGAQRSRKDLLFACAKPTAIFAKIYFF